MCTYAKLLNFMTFKKALHSWHGQNFLKSYNYMPFLDKQCPFTQNFTKQPKKFYKTKSS